MAESGRNLHDEDIHQSTVSESSSNIGNLAVPEMKPVQGRLKNISTKDFNGHQNATEVNDEAVTSLNGKDLPSQRLTSQEDWKEMRGSDIELSIECRDLIVADSSSKSNAIAVMFTQDGKTEKWFEYGRTEMIFDELNPDFVKKIVIGHHFEKKQRLRFDIYNGDDHERVGRVFCTLGQIIGRADYKYEAPLRNGSKIRGRIIISAEELDSSRDIIYMTWGGKKLKKKDVLENLNPFLKFLKCNEDRSFTVCHETEAIKNTLNPTWNEIVIQSRSFCNGDPERTIKVQVYDWNRDGGHDLLGEFETSLRRLSEVPRTENTYDCIHPMMKGTKKKHQHSGQLSLLDFRIDKKPTFLEYKRGVTMSCVVGIDFTYSNGAQDLPTSLHYIDPNQPNQYCLAIEAVGEILEDYDSDGLFPAYGFGAKLPPHGKRSHCFPINFNPKNDPNCKGIKGVLEAYRTCIEKIKLHTPTNFAPIIRRVSEMASQVTDGSEYFVLLMITDGVITDMDATKEEIVKAAKYPMSIIIIGVGNDDFTEMDELDGDTVRVSHRGVEAERDIVQFVRMRNHIGATKDHVLSISKLAEDVLEEIPDQLVDYMRSKDFLPKETL